MTTYTLAQALDDLLSHTEERVSDGVRSKGTLLMQQGHVRWLLQQFPPETPLAAIDELQLDALARVARKTGGQDARPLSPRTVQKRLSTLRRAYSVAARKRLVERIPLFPEFANPAWKPRDNVLRSFEELQSLLRVLQRYPHRVLWVQVAFWTCQHGSDVERMTWADVGNLDADVPWVKIRNTKNRKPWLFRVRCPRELAVALRLERDRLVALGRPPAPDAPLVKPWSNRAVMMTRACARAGIRVMAADQLRHSGVSAMIQRIGLTPGAQKWGGWSSFAMMERHYAFALPPALEQCAAELDAWAEREVG